MANIQNRSFGSCPESWKVSVSRVSLSAMATHSLLSVERQYRDLQSSLSVLSVELVPLHQKIVDLRKQLSVMSAEPKFNKAEFRGILEELRKIDQYVSASLPS